VVDAVDLDPGDRHAVADQRRSLLPPQQGLDAMDQRLELERLGDVIVGSHVEADDLVDLFAARGEHQDADAVRAGIAAQLAADLQPIDDRQHQVEDDQVGHQRAGAPQPFASVGRGMNLKALFRQVVTQDFDDRTLVLDEQDLLLHGWRP
jgi:hypothetical protein